MKQSADLKRLLTSIDHKSYPAYKDVRGAYDFNTYILSIDHVQGDPFASPSKVSVQVRHAKAGFPAELFDTPWKKTALEDYLLRCFSREIGRLSFKAKGSGKSGLIATAAPVRRSSPGPPARSEEMRLQPVSRLVSRHSGAPSTPVN